MKPLSPKHLCLDSALRTRAWSLGLFGAAEAVKYWGSIGNYRGCRVYIGVILGFYWDNGKENRALKWVQQMD